VINFGPFGGDTPWFAAKMITFMRRRTGKPDKVALLYPVSWTRFGR